jgi:hypothetical protein
MPSCERQARSAMINGFSAAARSFAASRSAAVSPCGCTGCVIFGMRGLPCTGSSCSSMSHITITGSIGAVIVNLWARTHDSAKCWSEAGLSSHFTKSRTRPAASCTLCVHSTPGRRLSACMPLLAKIIIGTRSHQAL